MANLISDTIDLDYGMTVQEAVDKLSSYGVDCADASFALGDDWATIEFKRPETDAERTKRLERDKRTREYAAAQKEKQKTAEYKLYLELAKKYNGSALTSE